MSFTESNYENAVLELLQSLGYNYQYGPDIVRDYHSPLYEDVLLPSLERINQGLPLAASVCLPDSTISRHAAWTAKSSPSQPR